ncbi:MAG: ankyrin repeat domain-containing protein [Gemmatimonadetes bacterium]|nr:ankyrin repeat domain-containing protein [Gemmatimonadota bacterium]
MRIPSLVTFLLLVGSAPATAHNPPRPAQDPPGRTPASCATWGARSFFSTASADTVAACIRAGADPLAPLDESGTTPLHSAARHSPYPEVIALLVRAGADVNARDLRDNTPLHGAWDNPISPLSPEPRLNRAAVEELGRQGADLLARNDRGEVADPASCEHWATPVFSRAADLMVYARCLEQGADLNTADYYGNTVLHHAAAHPDPAITTLLLRAGARTRTRNGVGASALHLAAEHEQPAVVAVLLETGAAIDARDDEGNTPLHMAAGNDSVLVVDALVRAGADINALNSGGVTPLVLAIERPGSRQRGNTTVADALLTAGTAVNISIPGGSRPPSTPLLAALWDLRGDPAKELTLRLLALGADPNARGDLGWGSLHLAADDGVEMIRALLQAGANPGLLDDSGESPLHPAARYADPETIAALLEAGANPNTPNDDGETPLHQAVAGGKADNVAALLDAGAQVSARTQAGETPLHRAAARPDTTVLSALVRAGADVNDRNDEGETPLHAAWKHGNTVANEHLVALGADTEATDGRGRIATPGPNCDWIDFNFFGDAPDESILGCVEAGAPLDMRDSFGNLPLHRLGGAYSDVAALATALIEAGAEVNGRDYHGRTPLHAAAGRDSEALASALLEGGAAVDARDTLGNTPLHAAAGRRGDANAVVALLARAGADLDARNNLGATPLHLAVESGNRAAAARLLALGADPAVRSGSGSVADPVSCENMNTRVFFAMASADVVAGCLDVGADVNARTEGSDSPFFRDPGSTPLHLAAEWTRDPMVIPMLLRAGADVLARGPSDYTALHVAARGGTPGTVRALIEAGVPVDVRAWGPGYHIGWDWTPLHLAAAHNPDPEVAAVLLAEGADVHALGETRQTPLHQAALNRNPAVALVLLEAGADVHARRSSGRTPLHEAARSNPNPEVIEALLDAGADPESPFASLPPLHEAARSNPGPEVITALIEGGADVNRVIGGPGGSLLRVSDLGIRLALRGSWTPLELAVGNNRNPAVVEALVRGGADLNSPGPRGWTALHAAASHNAAVFPILLRLGADPAVLNDEGRTPMDYAVDNQLLWGLEEVRRLRGGNPAVRRR